MVIFKQIKDIQAFLADKRATGHGSIGFVPTMGALHEGHISLINEAKKHNDLIVASIFINPTQFNDKSDFEKYPVSGEEDIKMLAEAACDVLFFPEREEVYPSGEKNNVSYEDEMDAVLEGAHRSGHFAGVRQVVARLLDIVDTDAIYLGQKDYQQCIVIKKLVQKLGKNIKVVVCPTMREADGLAMSSRNRRLTEPQRALAGLLYQCLVSIQAKQQTDSFQIVHKECMDLLRSKGFDPEYIVLADANNLSVLNDYTPGRKTVALIAAKIGDVRLIDNMVIS